MSLHGLFLACVDSNLRGVTDLVKRINIEDLSSLAPSIELNLQQWPDRVTVLHVACRFSSYAIVELLLESGARCDVKDSCGAIAIHYACESSIEPMDKVHKLISFNKGYVHARDADGMQPLHYSSAVGNTNVSLLLLENGAEVDAVGSNKHTPLHYAARKNHVANVTALLNWKANINQRNSVGNTSLQLAALNGSVDTVENLSAHPLCDIFIKNGDSQTALNLANIKVDELSRSPIANNEEFRYKNIATHMKNLINNPSKVLESNVGSINNNLELLKHSAISEDQNRRITSLESHISQLEKKIKELENQNKKQASKSVKERQDHEASINKLREEMLQMHQQTQQLQSEVNEQKVKLAELEYVHTSSFDSMFHIYLSIYHLNTLPQVSQVQSKHT